MECDQAQSNSEWAFDDENFCDQIYNEDDCQTSSASSTITARSAHAQNDEPHRHIRLCESITVTANSVDSDIDETDSNKTSSESSAVVVRREDAIDNKGPADLSSLAEAEGVQAEAAVEEEMMPKECPKSIKDVPKLPYTRKTMKVKKVEKKKKMSVTALKKRRDDRFFAGLDLDTDI